MPTCQHEKLTQLMSQLINRTNHPQWSQLADNVGQLTEWIWQTSTVNNSVIWLCSCRVGHCFQRLDSSASWLWWLKVDLSAFWLFDLLPCLVSSHNCAFTVSLSLMAQRLFSVKTLAFLVAIYATRHIYSLFAYLPVLWSENSCCCSCCMVAIMCIDSCNLAMSHYQTV